MDWTRHARTVWSNFNFAEDILIVPVLIIVSTSPYVAHLTASNVTPLCACTTFCFTFFTRRNLISGFFFLFPVAFHTRVRKRVATIYCSLHTRVNRIWSEHGIVSTQGLGKFGYFVKKVEILFTKPTQLIRRVVTLVTRVGSSLEKVSNDGSDWSVIFFRQF